MVLRGITIKASVSASGADGIHIGRSFKRPSWPSASCGNAVGTGTLVNRGTISSLRGTAVHEGQGDTLIVNSGTLIGGGGRAVDLGPGNDRVILQTGSQIVGEIEGGTGTNVLEVQGTGRVDNVFSGFQTLEVSGPGVWAFGSQSAFPDGATIRGGTLQVNGVLESPVTVNAGGVLAGAGTVSNVTTSPRAVVAPGNPLGTLTVQGDAVLLPGAAYQVAFAPTGDANRLRVGDSARIGGASMRIPANPEGRLRLNEPYTLITAEGGVGRSRYRGR